MRFGNTNAGGNANQKTTQGANPNESDLLEMTNSALRAYHRIQRPGVLGFSAGVFRGVFERIRRGNSAPCWNGFGGKGIKIGHFQLLCKRILPVFYFFVLC
jgi:hypothetical protein